MGVPTLPILEFRPSQCPRTRISNAASPRQEIYISKACNTVFKYLYSNAIV